MSMSLLGRWECWGYCPSGSLWGMSTTVERRVPPPIPCTDYLVPSPPMTRNRRMRKNGPAVAPPEAADDAAAARPVVADNATAARPEVARRHCSAPEEARDAAAPPVEAEKAAVPPVVADDAAAPQRAAEEGQRSSPEAAQDAALPPEAVIPPPRSRRRRRRRKASSVPHGLEAIRELAVSQEPVPVPSAGQEAIAELPKLLALPAALRLPVLPGPPLLPAKQLAPPWPPDGPELAWSVPPWPFSRVPVRPEPPWFVPPAPPWLFTRTPGLPESPWLNPPVPPWTCWASLAGTGLAPLPPLFVSVFRFFLSCLLLCVSLV